MKNKRNHIIFIIFTIIMGIFMFLTDIFFSINNWKLIIISCIGILISIFIILRINEKNISDTNNK